MHRLLHLLATCCVAAIPAGAGAQGADRPDVRAGDRWEFVVYYATPSTTPNRVWLVQSVVEDGIIGTENGQPLRLTRELNPRDSPLLEQSGTEMLRFPMRVGQQWTSVSQVRFKDNGSQARVESQVRVEAYERITVPAGNFDAFRLSATGSIAGTSYAGSGQLAGETRSTYWYAPAANAIVKVNSRSTYRGEATVELVSFQRAR
jgi:hypothetical protein